MNRLKGSKAIGSAAVIHYALPHSHQSLAASGGFRFKRSSGLPAGVDGGLLKFNEHRPAIPITEHFPAMSEPGSPSSPIEHAETKAKTDSDSERLLGTAVEATLLQLVKSIRSQSAHDAQSPNEETPPR